MQKINLQDLIQLLMRVQIYLQNNPVTIDGRSNLLQEVNEALKQLNGGKCSRKTVLGIVAKILTAVRSIADIIDLIDR